MFEVNLSADISNSWTLPDELEEHSEKKTVKTRYTLYKQGNLAKVNYHELFFCYLVVIDSLILYQVQNVAYLRIIRKY